MRNSIDSSKKGWTNFIIWTASWRKKALVITKQIKICETTTINISRASNYTYPCPFTLHWHVLLLVDNLTAYELFLEWLPKACDHGKAEKLDRRDSCLPERRLLLILVETTSLGTSLGWHNGKSSGLEGLSFSVFHHKDPGCQVLLVLSINHIIIINQKKKSHYHYA